MTEQTKIPMPEAASGDEQAKSLIERAVRKFDLRDLAPPPVPDNLAPPTPKPAMRHRPDTPGLAPPPQPMAATPVAPPAPTDAASVEASAILPPPQPASQSASQPVLPAVAFRGAPQPIDRQHLRDQGLIVPEGTVTALLEEFRIVKRQLLLNAADLRRGGKSGGGDDASQRILVSSPHPGEGKTWCAVNLALSMAAEREGEVILVDADFAKPSILSALGLPGGPGLMDALVDPSVDVADCVIGTDIPGLWVLPAGNATTADSEYLASSRTPEVLARLTQGAPHRIVIFDSPPVLAASPAAELAKHVGQTVLIVRADQTGQGALDDAVSLLSGCRNIELLLNAATFSPSGRRFGTYYGYRG